MDSPIDTPSPARALIDFIMRDFTVNGAHMLVIGHGEDTFFGFGKFRGELDFNFLEHRRFVGYVESKVDERDDLSGMLSFLCLTSYLGVEPPDQGRTFRFDEIRAPKRRYGWLLNNTMVRPLPAKSLKTMVRQEHKVKLSASEAPPADNYMVPPVRS